MAVVDAKSYQNTKEILLNYLLLCAVFFLFWLK